MEITALIISILALGLSLFQFIRDASRQKKEATLNAYNILQDDAFSYLKELPKEKLDPPPQYHSPEYNRITNYLAKIEIFSTGINTGIYSIWILNRLSGAFFIHQFDRLTAIINEKRKEDRVKGKHYNEFENTVKKLKRIRQMNDWINKITRTGGAK